MKYIHFPQGVFVEWRPKVLRNIEISDIKVIRSSVGKTGFDFHMCKGVISDEDACFLKLKGETFRITNFPSRTDK